MTPSIVYSFVCDPDECDTLIEVHTVHFGFPNGVVEMKCPCGRMMQYIERKELSNGL
jgi:hypothetical protein